MDLRLTPPKEYRLGPHDLLGVFVEGAYGPRNEVPPVRMPFEQDNNGQNLQNLPPATGYPVSVEDDGSIALPLVPRIAVEGLTLSQTADKIRDAYTVQKQLVPDRSKVIVSLMRKRTYQVLVIRDDKGQPSLPSYTPGQVLAEPQRGGYARILDLPAYENDVLHALVATGGLPGTAAKNEVVVYRGAFQSADEISKFMAQFQDPRQQIAAVAKISTISRIPLRILSDGTLTIPPEEIVLRDGDIVVVESRDAEVFYTGGLLRGGQFPLPRDYDLDVLGAIAMAGGSIGTSAGGTATSTGVVVTRNTGGLLPPTRVTVLRMQNGTQMPILVDLKKAMVDPRQRILIQPNDFILLEYTTPEVIGNLILDNVFISLAFTKSL